MPRPHGVKETKPRNTAARKFAFGIAAEGKPMPLEVMLQTMRERLEAGDADGALVAAGMAAPYVHARLASQQVQQLDKDGKPADPFACFVLTVERGPRV